MCAARHSQAGDAELLTDPDEIARKEAANGLEQADLVQKLIAMCVADGRPFKLRPSTVLSLHRAALNGISKYAGNWWPADVKIAESAHQPPGAYLVPELIEKMCDYVNENWKKAAPVHLAVYVMWRLNWIHPFTDGNGRTARAVSYLVLSSAAGMLLPGDKTIPEQIISNCSPYYKALEVADEADLRGGIEVAELEKMMASMLATQLLSVVEVATGAKKSGKSDVQTP